MDSQYFLNVSMNVFLFSFNYGPDICFTTDSPSSRFSPTFSLYKTLQRFIKMNEPTNSQVSAPTKHPMSTCKSLLPNFSARACFY